MDGFPFAGIAGYCERGILFPGIPDLNGAVVGIRFYLFPPTIRKLISVRIARSPCAQF